MIKKTLLAVTGILCVHFVYAQEIVKWSFSAKKVADKTYEIHLTPAVQSPWHIYSQSSPEDGALPTVFTFNKNPLVVLDGKVKEIGKIVSKYEDVFEVTVKYFEGRADFVQTVTLRQAQGGKPIKTNLTGSVEFMACNDEQCTPPQTVNFTIPIQ